jgi:hypothetical protein
MHRALLGVLAGVSKWGFRPGADRPVEDACDQRFFVWCPRRPLLVGC